MNNEKMVGVFFTQRYFMARCDSSRLWLCETVRLSLLFIQWSAREKTKSENNLSPWAYIFRQFNRSSRVCPRAGWNDRTHTPVLLHLGSPDQTSYDYRRLDFSVGDPTFFRDFISMIGNCNRLPFFLLALGKGQRCPTTERVFRSLRRGRDPI